jgi:hypothetical protein
MCTLAFTSNERILRNQLGWNQLTDSSMMLSNSFDSKPTSHSNANT